MLLFNFPPTDSRLETEASSSPDVKTSNEALSTVEIAEKLHNVKLNAINLQSYSILQF